MAMSARKRRYSDKRYEDLLDRLRAAGDATVDLVLPAAETRVRLGEP